MGCYKTLDIVVLVHICFSLFLTTLTPYFYFKLLHFKKMKTLSKSMFFIYCYKEAFLYIIKVGNRYLRKGDLLLVF